MKDPLANRLLRYPASIAMRLRIAYLRGLGAKIVGKCWIRKIELPRNPWDFWIDSAMLDNHVVLLSTGIRLAAPRVLIHRGVYINRFSMIDASERIEIGENCMIGPYCYITDHDHRVEGSTLVHEQPLESRPVVIGRNVWLGAGVCVLKGVSIGDGAVIGAGAVVTRNVPPGVTMAGVPAKQISVRMAVHV
jgi:maltose O-acetyltransferase